MSLGMCYLLVGVNYHIWPRAMFDLKELYVSVESANVMILNIVQVNVKMMYEGWVKTAKKIIKMFDYVIEIRFADMLL